MNTSAEGNLEKKPLRPEECDRYLLEAIEAGDIDTCVSLYEPSAVVFKKSGEAISGLDAVRQTYASMSALKPRFAIDFIKSTVSEDGSIGTNRMKASMTWQDAEGKQHNSMFHSLEVIRKQPDGSWRFIIDDPYGSMRDSLREH